MHCIQMTKIVLIFFPFFLAAQSPNLFWTSAATEDENIHKLAVDSKGNILIGATFEENFLSLPGRGGTDLALIQMNETGEIQWRQHFGSTRDDEWSGIVTDLEDNVYAAGSFWVDIQIDTVSLSSEKNAKALFLSKFTPNGSLNWVRKIEGTGLKVASEWAIDEKGQLLVTGYFSDTLFLGDQPLVANGDTDLFVARFLPNGQLDWASSAGYTGETRALSLSVLPKGAVALTGYYNDTTRIGNDQLSANTYDRDVFVCLYDAEGQPKWARRAGGVHDDDVTAIRYAEDDRLYITGYLVGVMNLSDEIAIQSATGNSDFYLLTYDTTGTPLTARAYGGRKIQQPTGLSWQDNQIWLSGFYQDEMTIDDQTINAGNGIGSFLARFGSDLQLQKIYNFPSEDNILINALTFDPTDRLFFGGSYTGNLSIGSQNIPSGGRFDLFLGQMLQATPIDPAIINPPEVSVFPNPASDQFFLKTNVEYDQIRLVNLQGITMFQSEQQLNSVPVSSLPMGMYVLLLYKDGQSWRVPVVVRK